MADKYDSQALYADALHFSTDIWSSSVVILGLALVLVGRQVFAHGWSEWPIRSQRWLWPGHRGRVSWRLARQTVDALLDAAPTGVRNQHHLRRFTEVDGVLEVDRVRIRRAGNRYFADLSVGHDRAMSRSSDRNRCHGEVARQIQQACCPTLT